MPTSELMEFAARRTDKLEQQVRFKSLIFAQLNDIIVFVSQLAREKREKAGMEKRIAKAEETVRDAVAV